MFYDNNTACRGYKGRLNTPWFFLPLLDRSLVLHTRNTDVDLDTIMNDEERKKCHKIIMERWTSNILSSKQHNYN